MTPDMTEAPHVGWPARRGFQGDDTPGGTPMTTSYRTTVQDPDAVIALAFLAAIVDAPVTVSDQITRTDCLVCNEVGRVTAATVYGDPVPEASQPAVVDCCPWCLATVADRARRELRNGSRVGVRIEVAPWVS